MDIVIVYETIVIIKASTAISGMSENTGGVIPGNLKSYPITAIQPPLPLQHTPSV